MPPRKASYGAAKRHQAAAPPARYGIQHFFSRHAANSQAVPMCQTAPAAPVRSAHPLTALHQRGEAEKELTLKVVQDRPQCVANDTIASPEADAQISPLRDGESRAPASVAWENARGIRPPGGDGSEAFNHQGQAIGVDANVVGKNISLQRSHDNHSASKAMPPPTSKYDGRANSIGCTSSPKERKRPRYSPGMVISQSQDDEVDEVVWKVSPTAERLLVAAASDNASRGRCPLAPCNSGRNTESLLNKATSMADKSASSSCKDLDIQKSPGIAGKLETWLSSPATKAGNPGRATPNVPSSADKENHPYVPNFEGSVARAGDREATNRKQQIFSSRQGGSNRSSRSTMKNSERSPKKVKKHPGSGERRKALLDLLDKVVDAIIVQEQQPESTACDPNGMVFRAVEQNCTTDMAPAIQDVARPCNDQDSKSCLSSRSQVAAHLMPAFGKERHPQNAAVEYSSSFELSAADLNVSEGPPPCTSSGKSSPRRDELEWESLSGSGMEHKIRTCIDAEDNYQEVQHLTIEDGVKKDSQASIHFLVLEVAEAVYEGDLQGAKYQQKVLRLLNEGSGLERVVYLRDAWFDSVVRPGDTVNVIGDFHEDGSCIVDMGNNLLVVHPDVLVSGSRVGASFSCSRRAILDERIKSIDVSAPALMGTMLHQLFQLALTAKVPARDLLESEAQAIVLRNLEGLYAVGCSQTEACKTLVDGIPKIQNWLQRYVSSSSHTVSRVELSRKNFASASICEVLDIEETIWSPKYGLKGMLDASVRVSGGGSGGLYPGIMPFELKTGRGTTGMAAMEHRAQVFLYTLLMSDRYGEKVTGGLLYYMHTDETQDLRVQRGELVGLMMRRNEHANSVLSASATQLLPPMLRSMYMCRSCRHLDVCSIYHKVQEGGSSESSGLGSLFDTRTEHLTAVDSEFLQLWDRLIDLEAQDMQVTHREIWRMNSRQREIQGRCLSSMVLDMGSQVSEVQETKGGKYIYCFRRKQLNERQKALMDVGGSLLDRSFSPGDFVILSTESGHIAVAAGVISSISSNSLLLSLEHKLRVPSRSGVRECDRPSQLTWRIDKDETASSIALMRYNLLQLFVKQSATERHSQLIVNLETPKFETGASITQDPANIYVKSTCGLNDDQKRAIHKILCAKDYALVLGMPGTGKTSLIVHAVKALVARGCSVLLTSYTNSAVDNILLKLEAEEVGFLRVGRFDAIHSELQKYALNSPEVQVESVEELDAKIQQARVVGATCLGITHALFAKRRFDVCIVDEAGQITLPVCLGPLRCADKFVLVGDHYQLPPLVRNAEAREKGMAISLFRRLCEAHPQCVSALQDQYRMCGDIMALCNSLIYGNRLRCGSAEVANAELALDSSPESCPHWLFQVLSPVRRVLFLDTDALSAEETRMRKALYNVAESSLVLKICKGLIGCGVAIQDIGVISPYNAQVDCIRRVANEAGLSALEVHTVDKYQGRDKECVVVSFVRSNASSGRANTGSLLTDWHRINVAITRAKKKLVLIGSQRTLSTTPLLSLLIRQVSELGGLVQLPRVLA